MLLKFFHRVAFLFGEVQLVASAFVGQGKGFAFIKQTIEIEVKEDEEPSR